MACGFTTFREILNYLGFFSLPIPSPKALLAPYEALTDLSETLSDPSKTLPAPSETLPAPS